MRDDSAAMKDPLLQPFQLGHVTLKNRIISTSHAISYGENGRPGQRYQLYHEAKATGGVALSMFGGASNVAPDSPSMFGQLDVSNDAIISDFQQFAERMHAHGTALMCQITHMGRRTSPFGGNWLSTIAPSRSREEMSRGFAREMTADDISRVVKAFGDAAWRCKEGGLDGCEVLATGHLVDQFWSRRVNRRTDDFGGSVANRARFGQLVLAEVRRRTGDNFIISLRMPMQEDVELGLTKEECLEIARLYRDEGLVDILGLVHGHLDTYKGLADYMPGMSRPIAPFLEMANTFRREVDMPVFHATRITDIATARHAIREKLMDLVGITRGHIADPNIVRKIEAGEEHRIRPCVGATYCSTYRQCIHNVATGREKLIPQSVPPTKGRRKKVVVIGGGPGGMEAARVAAARGHCVVLFEAADRLGGQVLLAAKASMRRDLIGIVDWLATELEVLNVDVRLNTYAEAGDVLAENPDVVVVATGGVPDTDSAPPSVPVLSTWDVLANPGAVSGSVLLVDNLGRHHAVTCAVDLGRRGVSVHLVTPDSAAAYETGKVERPHFMEKLYQGGAQVTVDHRLTGARRDGNGVIASFENALTGKVSEFRADHLVVENGTVPNIELHTELAERSSNRGYTDIECALAVQPQPGSELTEGFQLYSIGDAVSCRDIHTAMLEAMRICLPL